MGWVDSKEASISNRFLTVRLCFGYELPLDFTRRISIICRGQYRNKASNIGIHLNS